MNPYAQLPEEERIRQIGELLATAAIRYLSEQPLPPFRSHQGAPPPAVHYVWDLVGDQIEKQVLRHLSVHVAVQPLQLEEALKVPHRTLARRLVRLREAGLVVVTGKTKGVQYSLAAPSERN